MIVILRPIKKNAWSGVVKYRHCFEDLTPYWTRSGRVYTGLQKEDEKRLSELLSIDLSPSGEFFKNFFIRTSDKDIYLNTEDPLDEVRYLFLKNHKRVKASIFENKASANFVLINKDEEAKKANLLSRTEREAVKEFDKLSPDDMRKCLRLFGHNGDTMNNEVAEQTLFDLVKTNPQMFISRWVSNKTRDLEVLIERSISKNIIRRNKNTYKYGSDIIGYSMDDTIAFLSNPKNQDIKIAIMKQLDAKDSIEGLEGQFDIDEALIAATASPSNPAPSVRSSREIKAEIMEDEEEIAFKAERATKKSKDSTI